MMLFAPVRGFAADLKPETVQTWEEYVKAVSARNQRQFVSGGSFLSIDEMPDQVARLRAGEIVVSPVGPHVPMKVPSGLIHATLGWRRLSPQCDHPRCSSSHPRLRALQEHLPAQCPRLQAHGDKRRGRSVFAVADEQIGHRQGRAR